MAYRTVVIVRFTVSKQINTCPGDSDVIQCIYPLMNSQPAWCVCILTQSSDTVTKVLLNLHSSSRYIFRFHPCSNQEMLLFLQQPSVINMSHCEGDWASLAIHYLPLWNIVYILRLNVAVWIPNAPPLILSCWNITASRRIKTWLMAKVKSSHPVATCQFKSMRCGLAMLQHGWRGNLLKDLIGGLASGKWVKMGVPLVYLSSAGWGRVKHVGRGGVRILCGHKGNTEGEKAGLKRN